MKFGNNLWRRLDLNQRSSAYEADEITNFSTPLCLNALSSQTVHFFIIYIWLTNYKTIYIIKYNYKK